MSALTNYDKWNHIDDEDSDDAAPQYTMASPSDLAFVGPLSIVALMAGASLTPGKASPLENETVALLIISRCPRETHKTLAAVCKRFARIILSPEGSATLRAERVSSGWLDAAAPPMYRVAGAVARDLFAGGEKHLSPDYLFREDVRKCQLLFYSLVTKGSTDIRTAITQFSVDLVRTIYSPELKRLRGPLPQHLVGYMTFYEPNDGLGAGLADHLMHHAVVIDHIVKYYNRADAEHPWTFSYYGRQLVKLGLLREHYDECTETWTIDADGWLMRDIRRVWSHLYSPNKPCPIDAAVAAVYAYVLLMTNSEAKKKLTTPIVIGGHLDAYLRPYNGRPAAVGDILSINVQILGLPGMPRV